MCGNSSGYNQTQKAEMETLWSPRPLEKSVFFRVKTVFRVAGTAIWRSLSHANDAPVGPRIGEAVGPIKRARARLPCRPSTSTLAS